MCVPTAAVAPRCPSKRSTATGRCPSWRSFAAIWSMGPSHERHADYRFNTRIESLAQDDAGVEVTLSDGSRMRADVVVGADGPHSAVRRLVFGPEEQFVKPLGGYNAWFSAQDTVGLDGWYLMYQAPGLNASLRPSHDLAIARRDWLFVQSRLITIGAIWPHSGRCWWTGSRAPAGCATRCWRPRRRPIIFTSTRSRRCTCRHGRGRVALVGDAGYCASPLSGMGTSLALVGAYILAGEMGPAAEGVDSGRLDAAFARYQSAMRPYVDKCQDLPNTMDQYAPKSQSNVTANGFIWKWIQRWPFRAVAERLWFSTADAIDLPEYPAANAA